MPEQIPSELKIQLLIQQSFQIPIIYFNDGLYLSLTQNVFEYRPHVLRFHFP